MNEPKIYETKPQPVKAMQLFDIPSVWDIAQMFGAARVEINDAKSGATFTIPGEKGGTFIMNVNDWAIVDSENRALVRSNEAFGRLYREPKDNNGNGKGNSE